jgi:LPXTG-motif cell wall-anchored protein
LPFNQQAKTGLELWQVILAGASLMGGGFWLRRKK